jgi:hypothetical protein
MERAKVEINTELPFNEIFLGKGDDFYNLLGLLSMIHRKVSDCLQDISIQRQSENPNLEDIDSPLHGVLNLIEKVRGF